MTGYILCYYIYINKKLTIYLIIFLLDKKYIVSKEKKSAICQKVEDDSSKIYYKKFIGFFDNYLDKKKEVIMR